ncbi:hypothetical protein ADICYQ_5841 [Cyclobacterium qasimii M12-11B]|uniref:Uncharacterized protein n=1 Tax=Cyclobacterium qasimii M12-11B TaxID=641524 RepID=S7WM84_9BACT|nr:hypothetical protein ADICYQ_5841 [Cyclobacterium qasimii M12-11B]
MGLALLSNFIHKTTGLLFISFPLMKRNEPKKNLAKTKSHHTLPNAPRSFGPATAPLL